MLLDQLDFYFKEDTRELEKAKYRLDGPESEGWVMFLSSENSPLGFPLITVDYARVTVGFGWEKLSCCHFLI